MKTLVDLKKAVDSAKEIYVWVVIGETKLTENNVTVKAEVGGYMLTYKAQVKKLIALTNIPQQKITEAGFFMVGDTLYIERLETFVSDTKTLDPVA